MLEHEKTEARLAGLTSVARASLQRQSALDAQSISTEDGLEAARQVAATAMEEQVACALAGGIAMHLYGFTRATTDVDLIASKLLSLDVARRLSFGGASYVVEVSGHKVNVDWIVRDDDIADVYRAALDDAAGSELGVPIVTPEWLVILKKLADRGKDHLDLLWLLRREGLVNRQLVAELVRKTFGRFAFVLLNDLDALYLEADLMKAKDERDEGERAR